MLFKKHALFCVLLVASFVLRLLWLERNFQLDFGDGPFEYLAVSHMATFHEYPVFGPTSAYLPDLPTSPLYYYLFIPVFLLARNNLSFSVLTVGMNIVTMLSLYGLAYMLFGKRTAMITGLLLFFSQSLFDQTLYFWRPWLGQSLFLLSYVLLAYTYLRKNFISGIAGVLVFILGMSTGSHGFGALPAFFILSLLVFQNLRLSTKKSVIALGLIAGLSVSIYFPILRFLFNPTRLTNLIHDHGLVISFSEYVHRFAVNWHVLFDSVFILDRIGSQGLMFVSGIILLSGSYVLSVGIATRLKRWMTLLFFITSTVLIASVFRESKPYHFNTVNGLLFILFAEALSAVRLKSRSFFVIAFATVLFFIGPSPLYARLVISNSSVAPYLQSATNAIVNNLRPLEREYGEEWPLHVNMVNYEYHKDAYNTRMLEAFWASLEQTMRLPLTRFTIGGKDYVPRSLYHTYYIIICSNYPTITVAQEKCARRFIAENPVYTVNKIVFYSGVSNRYILFLASKTDPVEYGVLKFANVLY